MYIYWTLITTIIININLREMKISTQLLAVEIVYYY